MAISSVLGSSALLPAGLGFRNLFINGDFRINQRNFTSITSDQTYGFDRWLIATTSGATWTPQTFTVGNAISGFEPTNYSRIVTAGQSGTGVYTLLVQRLEDVRTLAGQQATLSFYVKVGSGTANIAVESYQFFGTGGSSAVTSYLGTVSATTTWQRVSLTFNLPSISGKTIGAGSSVGIQLWVSAGTDYNARSGSLGIQSNTFDMWGMQVERNSQATPFEQRPLAVELNLCKRYFWRCVDPAGVGVNNGSVQATRLLVPFHTEMRSAPTSTMSGTMNFWNGAATGTASGFIGVFNSKNHGQLDFNGGAGGSTGCVTLYTNGGSQYINFDSEL